jgi:ABC-type nickel/cobalt efflux system permease component RcnA
MKLLMKILVVGIFFLSLFVRENRAAAASLERLSTFSVASHEASDHSEHKSHSHRHRHGPGQPEHEHEHQHSNPWQGNSFAADAFILEGGFSFAVLGSSLNFLPSGDLVFFAPSLKGLFRPPISRS